MVVTVGTTCVPEFSNASCHGKVKIIISLIFQWFFAIRAVGIPQAKTVSLEQKTFNQN
jgi:hypothetical protein